MSQQTEYLLKVFEKIGTPLMVSILDAARGQPDNDNLEEHAKKMAELLGKTVQASIDLGTAIDINKLGDDSDAMRLSLAALLGPIIGQSYKNNRRIPDENDLKKITGALQSILSFSGSFTPTDQHNVRLDLLEAAAQNVDGPQTTIQQIQAFTPVLYAVSSFSFGQPEQKLMIDIITKLTNKAVEIRTASFGALNKDEQKRIDLALLKSLALLYQTCHEQEVARISTLSEDEQAAGLSLDPLWESFDKKAVLLQVLAENLMPENQDAKTTATTDDTAPKIATPPPVSTSAPDSPPVTPPPQKAATTEAKSEPKTETGVKTPATSDAGYNPMSMFSSKKPETEIKAPAKSAESLESTEPPASQTEAALPPATPPVEPITEQQQPPAEKTQAPPPTEASSEEKASDEKQTSNNPMSFFKTSDDKE